MVRAAVPPASAVISTFGTGSCFLGSAFAMSTAPASDSVPPEDAATSQSAIAITIARPTADNDPNCRPAPSGRFVLHVPSLGYMTPVRLRRSSKLGIVGEESTRSGGFSRRRLLRNLLGVGASAPFKLARSAGFRRRRRSLTGRQPVSGRSGEGEFSVLLGAGQPGDRTGQGPLQCTRVRSQRGGKHRGHRFRPDGALHRTGEWVGFVARCARACDRLAAASCRRRCPPTADSSITGPT